MNDAVRFFYLLVCKFHFNEGGLLASHNNFKHRLSFSTRKMCLLFNLILLAIFTHSSVANTPLINFPRVTYLDTNRGLDQDTIEDIHVDKEGFVWLGTGEGLNRFDGVKILNVRGLNNELSNNATYTIFEHSSGLFFLSTENNGVVSFNRNTHKIEPILAIENRYASGWLQYSEDMVELANGDLIIALSEGIYQYKPSSKEVSVIHKLSDQEVANGSLVRSVYANNSFILYGTTSGLYVIDNDSKKVSTLLETTNMSDDRNVKLLKSFDKDTLFVGTVKGLYTFSLGEIGNFVSMNWGQPQFTVVDNKRNIWDMARTKSGEVYIATDIGLYYLQEKTNQLAYLFETKKHFEVLSRPDITNLTLDHSENLWLGTVVSGAMLWSPRSLLFSNVYNSVFSERDYKLSNNAVWSLYQYDTSSLFVGTSNGLNHYNLNTQKIEQFYVQNEKQADYSEAEINQIFSTERGYLWLTTGGGVRYFDINKKQYVPVPAASEEASAILNEWSYSLGFEGKDKIWTLTENGIFVVDRLNGEVIEIDLQKHNLSAANAGFFIGIDKPTNRMLVAATSELWAVNLDDLSVSVVHSIKHETSNRSIYPGNLIRTKHDTAWLSYPGHALFKLEAKSFTLLDKLSTQNILPTNLVYDLREDKEGFLWFSSHSGIHQLDPDNLEVHSFGFLNGLATSEFNQYASQTLSDGRIVFGANLGFSMFQPSQLRANSNIVANKPYLTEFSVATRKLRLPLTALNDMELSLEHDDVGLTLHYSALSFDQDVNRRFHYRITSNGEAVNYPNFNANIISLPTLSAGQHIIEVFQPGPNQEELSAKLILNVKYPIFSSPIAYFVYALLFLLMLAIFLIRRQRIVKVIANANKQVQEYNTRLTEALTASNSNIWEWNSDNNKIYCDRIKTDFSDNLHTDSLSMTDYVDFIHDNDRLRFLGKWQAFLAKKDRTFDITYRVVSAKGKYLWYRDIGSLSVSPNGKTTVKGTYTNLTEKHANEEKLKLFGKAYKHTRDWVLIFDKHRQLVATNPAFMKAFNLTRARNITPDKLPNEYQELLHRTTKQLASMKPGQHVKSELRLQLNDKEVHVLTDMNAISDTNTPELIDYYLIIGTDISEQMHAQQELQKLVNYDVLTGLFNRTLLLERLTQSIAYAKRHQHGFAVLFIDLDGFKPINDSFGHIAGDSVLVEVAARIKQNFREEDSVARLGGDEFLVVLEEVQTVDSINETVAALLQVIAQPQQINQQAISVTASIGIALYPQDAETPETLVTYSDIAMYNAKASGKNKYQYYKSDMNQIVQSKTILLNKIKIAAEQNEFINNYQAIVNGETGATEGFEMLLRWQDNQTPVPPDVFIPMAEQAGCIVNITMDAIERTILDLAHWYNAGFKGYVAINLSAKHFVNRPDFETILNQLKAHNLPTSSLRFEITEGLFIDSTVNSIEYMRQMRAYGFKIALDDFGTGYSSLKYIKDFPLDVIKIDRSFVQDVITDNGTESIVQTTLLMTSLLGLDSVAEGVETLEQFNYFVKYGCKFIQGYYFDKPMPANDVVDVLHKNWLIDHNKENNTLSSE